MINAVDLPNFWQLKLADGPPLHCLPQDILNKKLSDDPFVDSFRVEVPMAQIKDMDHLFAQGATLKPSKDFIQRIVSSKKIELDVNIKCL